MSVTTRGDDSDRATPDDPTLPATLLPLVRKLDRIFRRPTKAECLEFGEVFEALVGHEHFGSVSAVEGWVEARYGYCRSHQQRLRKFARNHAKIVELAGDGYAGMTFSAALALIEPPKPAIRDAEFPPPLPGEFDTERSLGSIMGEGLRQEMQADVKEANRKALNPYVAERDRKKLDEIRLVLANAADLPECYRHKVVVVLPRWVTHRKNEKKKGQKNPRQKGRKNGPKNSNKRSDA